MNVSSAGPSSSRLSPPQRALLHRIRRRYRTVTEVLQFGSLSIAFTRIEDPDRVLDEVAEAEDRREKLTGRRHGPDELRLPYWAELWDSARGMGEFLVGAGQWLPTAHCPLPAVLDLGCGMGLAGTVAAALGHRVLFADLEPPALLFAQLNSLPWTSRVRTRVLNWQTDRLGESFDLILGSDILYERSQWEFLERFWRAHLKPAGRVLLGEPGRQTGDLFQLWIVKHGWQLREHEQKVETRTRPIRLFEIWL